MRCCIAAGAVAWAGAYYLGRTWGSTRDERAARLPGDELVPNPVLGGNHAITIRARPAAVWPWLLQVGWGRGGWYTYRWVDRLLFPDNRPSAVTILPQFQDLDVGDRIPDGPPQSGCFFVVEAIEPERALVLRSTTHLPPSLQNKSWVRLNWTWAFVLEPQGSEATRFQFRWRAELQPLWLRLLFDALITPADFLMGRSMCKGLKRRAEALSRAPET